MDTRVMTLLDAQGGVGSVRQLNEAGVSRHVLRRLVRRGVVTRLPRSIVVDRATWEAAPAWDRHALRARGLMLGGYGEAGNTHALSHHSALSLMGVPLFGVDNRVHVVRTDGGRVKSDAFLQGHIPLPEEWVRMHDSTRIVRPELAVLQVAMASGPEAGLVSADACLHWGLISRAALVTALELVGDSNAASCARRVVELADHTSESPGESRCRWIFALLRLPRPTPQSAIWDTRGELIGRVDFLFEAQRVVVEFDGQVKYKNQAALFQEKQREDALRALGYIVVGLTWRDLSRPHVVQQKLSTAFRIARAR